MAKRINNVEFDSNLQVSTKLESGVVKVLVLDGVQGCVRECAAVAHGRTIVETSNGKTKRISFEEFELFN